MVLNIKVCIRDGCDNLLLKRHQKKYCSNRCSAIVNNHKNPKRKKMDRGTFQCLSCGKINSKKSNTLNKYCNMTCNQNHRWKLRKESIENDELMGSSVGAKRTLIRYFKKMDKWFCTVCKLGTMTKEGHKVSHEIHHIDGNPCNNRLSNVEIRCRNCHGVTVNFKGLNKKKHKQEEVN
jgi:hypothetical protein